VGGQGQYVVQQLGDRQGRRRRRKHRHLENVGSS
jgi:hypothetical protein